MENTAFVDEKETKVDKQNTHINANEASTQEGVLFWTDDPNILFDWKYMTEWFPTDGMNFNQKLNAISRTIIFVTILVVFMTRSLRVLFGSILTLGCIVLLHINHKDDKDKNKNKEGFDEFSEADKYIPQHKEQNQTNIHLLPIHPNGDLKQNLNTKKKTTNSILFDTPTPKNPFCNVLITDYTENPNKKQAPPTNQETILENIKAQIDKNNPSLSKKLFHSLHESLHLEQSLRPFHSTASTTIPNDQAAFAEFCYGGMKSCREGNVFACVRNNAYNHNLY